MKKILIGTFCFLLFISLQYQKKTEFESKNREVSSMDKSIGYIIQFKGTVFLNDKKVTQKQLVFEKDIIETKSGSFAKIRYNDESIFVASSNTKFEILEFKMKNKNNRVFKTFLELGKLKTKFLHKNNSGIIRVSTKTASMGVRGTEFITEVNNQSTNVFLIEGKIDLNIKDKILKISPNESIKINNDFQYQRSIFKESDLVNIFEDELLDFDKQNKIIQNQIKKQSVPHNNIPFQKVTHNNKGSLDSNKVSTTKASVNKISENKPSQKNQDNNTNSNKKPSVLKEILSEKNNNKSRSPSSVMPVDPSTDFQEYKDQTFTSESLPRLIKDMNNLNLTPRQKANVVKEILSEDNLINYRKQLTDKYQMENYENIEEIKEEIKELSIEELKVLQRIISEGKAFPLRDNEEILFFERYPEILKVLPKDSEGNTIAIDLVDNEIKRDIPVTYDELGNPIDIIVDDNGNPISVPVIDGYGEIQYVPIEKDGKVVLLPKVDSEEELGVPVNEQNNTVDINLLETVEATLDTTRTELDDSQLLVDPLNEKNNILDPLIK